MIKIAICDDNPTHLQLAEKLVENKYPETKKPYIIQMFSSSELMLSEVNGNGYMPDIAVLDIEMDGEDGITLAKKLNNAVPQCRIIFLTSYLDYAQDAYEAEHIWFVVKKDADQYFEPALQKALISLEEKDSTIPGIVIRDKGTSMFVPLDQILYISKVARKAQIKCIDAEYADTRRPALLIPDKLKQSFLRCHQGYWINIQMIRELDHNTFILKDGTVIPISRTYRNTARKCFFERFLIK